ncbi:hypothetical protein [Phocoenobacter skyensis]|uniref:Uncharacterized protein n=1 Tax=Phocoenobacter skyensis TaxID=97481 RepID=A0AAJ6P2K0_9PAST|nr:hypothetical protein [Pasteurella skyensis]MDP8174799.1 hypothetical protein [Pasteurella skyensis]
MTINVMFNLNTDDLPPIIDVLKDALFNRPEPDYFYYDNLDSAIVSAIDYAEAIDKCRYATGTLYAADLLEIAEKMASGYTSLWKHSFPKGLEQGQALFSQILEKPMRQLLRNLELLVDPNNTTKLTSPLITLEAEREVDYFNNWRESIEYDYDDEDSTKSHNFSSLLLAAGLFGLWLGGD